MKLVSINTETLVTMTDEVTSDLAETYEMLDGLFNLVQYLDGAFVCNTKAMISTAVINFSNNEEVARLISILTNHLNQLGGDTVNTITSLVGEDTYE